MKKIINIIILISFISFNTYSQLKVQTNGELRLWTNNTGAWGSSMITYANNNYSKAYVVDRNGSHKFFVRGDGYVYARGSYINSDMNLKKGIKEIENVDNLFKLKAKSYKYKTKQDESTAIKQGNSNDENVDLNQEENNPKQYGFIAQEVKELYPELVSEDENGLLSINYNAFIPLMHEAIKQQKSQIETLQEIVYSQEQELVKIKKEFTSCCTLKNDNSNLKSESSNNTSYDNENAIDQEAELFKNSPNPFSSITEIGFFIPHISRSSQLIIHDMQGIEIKSFDINQTGRASITMNGSELDAGMYLYTLLIDNKIIDTKRMLLTKN